MNSNSQTYILSMATLQYVFFLFFLPVFSVVCIFHLHFAIEEGRCGELICMLLHILQCDYCTCTHRGVDVETIYRAALILHAYRHTNTHQWASLQEGVEASQPERHQGNVVSDHLIGLAPDRKRLLHQPVRGPKLTLQSHFGSVWLCAESLRKTANPGPQSFCLCHYWLLFNHFSSSFHIIKTHK